MKLLTQYQQITKLSLVLLLLIIGCSFKADRDRVGTRFLYNVTWRDLCHQAKIKKKPMFLFVAGNYCGTSRKMKEKVFRSWQVGMFLNENFISTIYDPEILVNHFRLTNWGVTSVPTCLFFTPSGKKVQAINGYLDKDQFLQIAMETLANMQENHPANVEPDPTDTEAKDTTKAGTAPMEQGSTIAEPQADSTTSKN